MAIFLPSSDVRSGNNRKNSTELPYIPLSLCVLVEPTKKLFNEYLNAKMGVDTEENEPVKVLEVIQFNIQSHPYLALRASNFVFKFN